MNNIEEAISHYSSRKANSELSLSEIRSELTAEDKFSTAEISKICRTISDNEMKGLNKEKVNPAAILNHPAVAYILLILFAGLIYVSFVGILDLDQGSARKTKIWRYALMIGSIFFFLRNLIRVINHIKLSRSN